MWLGWLLASSLVMSAPASAASAAPAPSAAAVVTEGGSGIVQQGLTIHELDKELERLVRQQNSIDEQIANTQHRIEGQKEALELKTAAAGKVLRAYYMGRRDRLWMLIFEMRSFSEALTALDYLRSIVSNDYRTLELYRTAYEEQQALLAELEQRREELRSIIAEHQRQRERLIAAQEELDRQLAELTESERLAELERIESLTASWEREGIPLFEQVMDALSTAMRDFPELLSDPGLLTVKGSQMEIRLTEDRLNAFLKERNPLFQQFQFTFDPEGLSVSGTIENNTASIRGAYVMEEEPASLLRFHIQEITYNGYTLPDTTGKALQEQFDLSFEPGRLVAGLVISDIANDEGEMRVMLGFSLASR